MDIYNVANAMKVERKTIFDLNLRVTFYGRVSTLKMEQDTSIDSQISYFTQFIESNSNWEYVQGYADRIRGENAVSRDEFMRMIEDAKQGKFDNYKGSFAFCKRYSGQFKLCKRTSSSWCRCILSKR